MSISNTSPFLFGIYPGGAAGTSTGMATGPADDPAAIHYALDQLQADVPLFIVRNYAHYEGNEQLTDEKNAVRQIAWYCNQARKLNLVVCFHAHAFVAPDWERAISQLFDTYGDLLHSIQIAEEPNLYHFPGDGRYADIASVVIHGVKFAKQEARRRGLSVRIGFNAIPTFNSADPFWIALGSQIDSDFLDALDYVGIDFFPDVFRPIAQLEEVRNGVKALLHHFRHVTLADVGIGTHIPMTITENGWPTSSTRTEAQQAVVLDAVIRMVVALRYELHITEYCLFSLRDADSSHNDMMYQFGILRDDYYPKQAFHTYQQLITELAT